MRFDFFAAAAVTAIAIHLKVLCEVSGLPITSVDGPKLASDYHDIVFVNNSFIDRGRNDSEERSPSKNSGLE